MARAANAPPADGRARQQAGAPAGPNPWQHRVATAAATVRARDQRDTERGYFPTAPIPTAPVSAAPFLTAPIPSAAVPSGLAPTPTASLQYQQYLCGIGVASEPTPPLTNPIGSSATVEWQRSGQLGLVVSSDG